MSDTPEPRPTLAKGYTFKRDEWPEIDGQRIPWMVAESGPLVEEVFPTVHILWVPILVDAPMPTPPAGRPDGVPLEGEACTCRVDPLDRMPLIDARCPVHSPTARGGDDR